MTKEFENFRQILDNKKAELAFQARVKKQEEENKNRENERIREQKRIESEKISSENKKIFEDAGVVKLFEEIRDSGIVKAGNYPQYQYVPKYKEKLFGDKVKIGEEKIKISDYEPARIRFDDQNKRITLAFNIEESGGDRYSNGYYHDNHITFLILENKRIAIECYESKQESCNSKIRVEKEILDYKEIPNIIAEKISETLT